MIHWPKRPKIRTTLTARVRSWTSRCKRYRVEEFQQLLGGEKRYGDIVYTERWEEINGKECWTLVGKHRKVEAAMKELEKKEKEEKS